ncbi:MAG TPA: 4Fe-4S dicluster domain-containing protein [Bacteroidales bacterium]|nr:4Fe-4S dicluster domain-containing protein [Bacteroidales bacterium]
MKRQVIQIDEQKCTGCGDCVTGCAEGALQIIDGKARLISDVLCDGLGACIGVCPEGAIEIIEREAEPYNEIKVVAQMVKQGKNTLVAHMKHLKEHDMHEYLKQAVGYLMEHKSELPFNAEEVIREVHFYNPHGGHGCLGSKTMQFKKTENTSATDIDQSSELRQWPVQMHLISPVAPYFQNADVLLAADCVAYTLGNFHSKYLKNKSLAVACPKLDSNQDVYLEKLVRMMDEAQINTLTVMIMEVPCCGGLLRLVQSALARSERKVPVKVIKVGVQGDILEDKWINFN